MEVVALTGWDVAGAAVVIVLAYPVAAILGRIAMRAELEPEEPLSDVWKRIVLIKVCKRNKRRHAAQVDIVTPISY